MPDIQSVIRLASTAPRRIGGDDPDRDDAVRAGWAAAAVTAFAERTGQTVGEDAGTVLADILADLRHLADRLGMDWWELLAHAAYHHAAEVAEAGGTEPQPGAWAVLAEAPDQPASLAVFGPLAAAVQTVTVDRYYLGQDGRLEEPTYATDLLGRLGPAPDAVREYVAGLLES